MRPREVSDLPKVVLLMSSRDGNPNHIVGIHINHCPAFPNEVISNMKDVGTYFLMNLGIHVEGSNLFFISKSYLIFLVFS